MPRTLMNLILVTDIVFMTYWTLAALMLAGLVSIPPEYMYANYGDARVVAWNWSFFPLDLLFSVFGFWSVKKARDGDPLWRPLAIVSLVLTMTAGGMAIAYWAILQEFDPSWFLPNLVLFLWPVFFLPGLIRKTGSV